jgi:hypothetical protein
LRHEHATGCFGFKVVDVAFGQSREIRTHAQAGFDPALDAALLNPDDDVLAASATPGGPGGAPQQAASSASKRSPFSGVFCACPTPALTLSLRSGSPAPHGLATGPSP